MKLSELFELSPLGWEEAKRLTILEDGEEYWDKMVNEDRYIENCFFFEDSGNVEMWDKLAIYNDPTLLKEWDAKQIKTVKQ